MKFWSLKVGGRWARMVCIIYQPTQSNVPPESNLAEQTDRFFGKSPNLQKITAKTALKTLEL